MFRTERAKTITRLVKMEERIASCNRCRNIRTCCPKSALGRGDVEPGILLAFLAQNNFTRDQESVINMRKELEALNDNRFKAYHTYLVRCQHRICSRRQGKDVLLDGKLINSDMVCLLNGQTCDGVALEPTDQDIMNCLHFFLEEIEILHPRIIVTCGEMTYHYVFRAFGLLDACSRTFEEVKNQLYQTSSYFFIPIDMPLPGHSPFFDGLKEQFQTILKQI